MPRQLPWLQNGGGSSSRTQTKKPTKATAKTTAKATAGRKIPLDVDDDFFDGTVLASSGKGKGKAVIPDDSDEDQPGRPRLPSSSPPPIQDYVQPQAEYMRNGTTRYDLRDDEWMMVEDEFLETAKLFTRHLHIAEYERLKKEIAAKKTKQADAARPIVKDAELSAEGKVKEKVKTLERKQKKAIHDVFASQDDDSEDDMDPDTKNSDKKPSPTISRRTSHLKLPPRLTQGSASGSNDLDDSRPLLSRTLDKKKSGSSPIISSKISETAIAKSTPSFAKPGLPATAPKPRAVTSRRSRATPFDMLDDYVPPKSRTQPQSNTTESKSATPRPSTTPASLAAIPKAPAQPPTPFRRQSVTFDDNDDDGWGTSRRTRESSSISKETAERLAKRKAEREKEKQDKKAVKLDDIPTFLF